MSDLAVLVDRLAVIIKRQGLRRLDEPVELACGAMSSDFIDTKAALGQWGDLEVAGLAIAGSVEGAGIGFDAAGGLTMGADALAVSVAAAAGCGWFTVRKQPKQRGTRRLIEGVEIGVGSRVLLLEDVATTGGSAEQAYRVVSESGAEVVAVAAVVDRGDAAGARFEELGVPYFPMITYTDLGIEPVVVG